MGRDRVLRIEDPDCADGCLRALIRIRATTGAFVGMRSGVHFVMEPHENHAPQAEDVIGAQIAGPIQMHVDGFAHGLDQAYVRLPVRPLHEEIETRIPEATARGNNGE